MDVTVSQPRGGSTADRHGAPRRHVRRLGGVDEVAGGEDPGCARRAVDVTGRTDRAVIHRERGQAGELVVGDEVPAEHDDVDRHHAFGTVWAADEHSVHAVASGYRDDGRPGPHRHAEADTGREVEGTERLRVLQIGGQRHRAHTRFAQGQYCGVRHVLGSHNERPPAEWKAVAVHPLLELAGREDPRGPRSRNEACCPRPLPRAGGEDDGACVHLQQPVGAGHLSLPPAGPPGHHGAGPDLHAAGARPLDPAAGVGRTAQDASQIPHTEAGVLAQAGDSACLVLPVEHHDASRAARLQRSRRGQAGGPGSDDQCVDGQDGARHAFTAAPTGPQLPRRRRTLDSAHWSPGYDGPGRRRRWRAPSRRGRRAPRLR